MRYFIFFYKLQNRTGHTYGQYGTWAKLLPSNLYIAEQVSNGTPDFKPSEVNIMSFNEVIKADYDSFFNKS